MGSDQEVKGFTFANLSFGITSHKIEGFSKKLKGGGGGWARAEGG